MARDDGGDGDGEWRFTVADIDAEDEEERLVPGTPDPENAVFFVAGILFTVAVVVFFFM